MGSANWVYWRLGLLLACAGCAARDASPSVQHRDSAGVRISETHSPRWQTGEKWEVDSVPLIDLATSGAGPGHEFYRVRDATRLRDGRIVVGQSGTNEARIFREGGSFERSMGRTGDGPGEFRRLTSVTSFRGDSLIVFDYWTRRLAVFDDDGRLGRQLTLDAVKRTEQVYPLPDGRLVLHASSIEAMAGAQGRTRIPEPIVLLSPDGLLVDTIAIAAGFETHVFAGGDALPPLGRDSHVALRDSVVILGDATHMQYRVMDLEGRLLQVVRFPSVDLAVSEAERDSIHRGIVGQELPARLRDVAEEMAREIPKARPAYSGILVDAEGYVWLANGPRILGFSGRPREWLVADPAGQWLGSVLLPANFEAYEVGRDYVLGRRFDELGIETVQMLRLSRHKAGSPT